MKHLISKIALVIFSLSLLSGGCDDQKETPATTVNSETTMKTPFQFSGYEQDWKKVDSLESQGLPKSALEIVNVIMDRASKEKNQPMQKDL